ncbi:hypothetical protein [Streptomyces sp. NPDC057877]|uniref:hypothetical protein n=1 Tax=Streptomyces sp. NPDC057877 TaxID=3346269 RepID=UPI0036CD6219
MTLDTTAGTPPRSRAPGTGTAHTTVLRTSAVLAVVIALLAAALGAAAPSRAAQTGCHEVTDFGSDPGNLKMFAHVPQQARSGAPVVVLFHGCGGAAQNLDVTTGWRKYADQRHGS